ncbi:MAG: hypothetical protein GY835_02460 [bacterium]|nr:hypothetical protein [bacterium]
MTGGRIGTIRGYVGIDKRTIQPIEMMYELNGWIPEILASRLATHMSRYSLNPSHISLSADAGAAIAM